MMCDDEGRFLADPRQVKADVWPLDDDITPKKLEKWLPQLATVTVTHDDGVRSPAVVFYEVDGIQYGFLPGFVKHQKISHPTASKLPKPPSIDKPPTPPTSADNPEPLQNDSGAPPENLRPDEDRIGLGLGLGDGLGSGEEGQTPPRVELPREAMAFLGMFYEPAFNDTQRKRYRDILSQLYDVLDPKHPGPKIRGGKRVKARSAEHLIESINAVMKNPPPNRDHAIIWLLNKLLDPPKESVTEEHKKRHAANVEVEERYFAEAKRAGVEWAKDHPDEYQKIVREIDANYKGNRTQSAALAREAELTTKCSKAAAFPEFEKWLEQQKVPA